MGKTAKVGANATVLLRIISEGSKNQGFLKVLGKKASHGLEVEVPVKNGKGLKSGEPFSCINHTNYSAKKGRK
jgi:hypothetical protein